MFKNTELMESEEKLKELLRFSVWNGMEFCIEVSCVLDARPLSKAEIIILKKSNTMYWRGKELKFLCLSVAESCVPNLLVLAPDSDSHELLGVSVDRIYEISLGTVSNERRDTRGFIGRLNNGRAVCVLNKDDLMVMAKEIK